MLIGDDNDIGNSNRNRKEEQKAPSTLVEENADTAARETQGKANQSYTPLECQAFYQTFLGYVLFW